MDILKGLVSLEDRVRQKAYSDLNGLVDKKFNVLESGLVVNELSSLSLVSKNSDGTPNYRPANIYQVLHVVKKDIIAAMRLQVEQKAIDDFLLEFEHLNDRLADLENR